MAYKIGIAEILIECNKKKYKKDKIEYLKQHKDNSILLGILRLAFDSKKKWLLPAGDVPYSPATKSSDQQGMLYAEFRRMYLFIEGGHPTLNQKRREELYIGLLETLDPDDALLIASMKDGKLPWRGITRALIEETFPGLLTGEENVEGKAA